MPVVEELIRLIRENGWDDKFKQALEKVNRCHIVGMEKLNSLNEYFDWLDKLLRWIPMENNYGTLVYEYVCKFYFVLDQDPLLGLQNEIKPSDKMLPLTPLSAWIVKYINSMGEFMDTPESFSPETEKTFYDSPVYNMSEYMRPRAGWKCYNDFFARFCKPGARPIAAIADSSVIVSPADSVYCGHWEVREDSEVTVKGLHWKIMELLEGSPYKDRFKGGYFTHSFLSTPDYHRQHAPVGGRVIEARNIQGTAYINITSAPVPDDIDGNNQLVTKRIFQIIDEPGYQFLQTRGLVILDSPIGLVAVLPMGMGPVSSVVITAEEGRTLRKGEEISYFQFGGSDIVMVFEASSNVSFTAQPGAHYRYGTKLADAYPVI